MTITVVVPVGPFEANQRWLNECVQSVSTQTHLPNEIIIINDGAKRPRNSVFMQENMRVKYYTPPWRLGVGHAFNFGVALADNNLIFMLGSDDTLEPTCLERCLDAWEAASRMDAYYWVPVRYMSDGRSQHTPCNAAMVTKGLWKKTGGFPIEATTAPDAALLSILMVHAPDLIVRASSTPEYNYRDHEETDTKQHGAWHATNVIVETRNLLTKEFVEPTWTQNFI